MASFDFTPYLVEALKWFLYVAVPTIIVWFLALLAVRKSKKKKREAILSLLSGLPADAKGILSIFKEEGSHTVVLNPHDPSVEYLKGMGMIQYAGSAGSK